MRGLIRLAGVTVGSMVVLLGAAAGLLASAGPAAAAATPTLKTTPKPTKVTLGAATVPTLTDSAVLAGGSAPTGTITFTLFVNGGGTPVDTETVTVSGNGTYKTPAGFTLPTTGAATGTYQWDATYSGDGNNNSVSDTGNPGERVAVTKASPAIKTTPKPAKVTLGAGTAPTLTDSAALTRGYNETGTLTFTLFVNGGRTPVDTETVTVSGNGTYKTPTGFTLPAGAVAGAYQWDAAYSGDANNKAASDTGKAGERVVVAYGFGGFLSPLPKATLKAGSTISVKFRLINAAGQPIARAIAAKLAARHDVTAALTGPRVKRHSISCTWNRAHRFFQCNIKTPRGVRTGRAHPYLITAFEKIGGRSVRAPAVPTATTSNPESVFFKKRR